jgi:hypothetical protein
MGGLTAMSDAGSTFPVLAARSLNGRACTLPFDRGGTCSLIVLVFHRRHQRLAAGWLPALERIAAGYERLPIVTLHIIASVYTLARPFLDSALAAESADRHVRERTLTAYVDVQQVVQALAVPTSTISVVLLDPSGRICWRGHGAYDTQQAAALEQALRATAACVAKPSTHRI